MRVLQDYRRGESMLLFLIVTIFNRLFKKPDEEAVLKCLDLVQWIQLDPWTIARDLDCCGRKTKRVLDSLSARGLVRDLSYEDDEAGGKVYSYSITRAGMTKIGSHPKPRPNVPKGNEYAHVLH